MESIMISRIELPEVSGLTPEQNGIYESIKRSRGNLDGPFLAWLHSPEMASPAEQLGAFCRYGTLLSLQESELLILCVAAHHRCDGEQKIHEPIALQSGVSNANIELIRNHKAPSFDNHRMTLLSGLATELLQTNRINEALFVEAKEVLGHQTLVETVGVIGYYTLVAHTLNAFEMGIAT
jgi:4-carboxymuconolactone decarboxylase